MSKEPLSGSSAPGRAASNEALQRQLARVRGQCDENLGVALAKYAALVGPLPAPRTLHDVIERYRLSVLPLKRLAQTRKDEDRALTRFEGVFGHFLPDNLTAPQCYTYLDVRRDKDGELAPVAARHEISLLGHVLGKAIRWGAATTNVVRTLEKQPKNKRTRYVTDEEFAACRALANPRMQIAMDLARNIGQRRGDLLRLRHADCLETGVIFRQGKTGAGVLVEWTVALRATVEASKKLTPDIPREFVIRKRNGRGYTARGFSAIWQRLMAKYVKVGGVRFTFHDLRAKAGSDKATIEEAAALLGHASTETTKRVYKHNLTRARPVE